MSKKEKLLRRELICILSILGVILQLLSKRDNLITNLTVHTTLSNLYIFGYFLALVIATKKGKDKDFHPWFRYSSLSCVLMTFITANTLLNSMYLEENFMFSIAIIIMHIIVPVLATIDYVKAEKLSLEKHFIVTGILPSLAYSTMVMCCLLINRNIVSPYYFLDVVHTGFPKVFLYLTLVSIAIVAINIILYKQNENKRK